MTRPQPMQRRVVLTGTFDVRNYGDLLFPLIAAHRLDPLGITLRPASPTGHDTGWRDAVRPEPLRHALLGQEPLDGVLIGGGNIIHARPVTLPDYLRAGVADWAYGGLWLGATMAGARRGVPVFWNAPGVPHGFTDAEQPILRAALDAASHVAVRDHASAALLAPFRPGVVPDTALGLAALWSKSSLEPAFRQLLARTQIGPAGRFVAIHVKARSVDGPPETLAPLVDAFSAATGAVPIVVALGHCHDDHIAAARLCAALTVPHLDLSHPLGLREIASAIAYSQAYVGASMHGYITAAVYAVPGVIVARPSLPKMQGVLSHLDRRMDEWGDWATALAAMVPRLGKPGPAISPHVHAELNEHWRVVADGICRPVVDVTRQRAFLDLMEAQGNPAAPWNGQALKDSTVS